MSHTRREALGAFAAAAGSLAAQSKGPTKYVRFRKGSATAFGVLEGDTVRELRGDLFASPQPSGARHKVSDVKLLYPYVPPKALAVGLNYKSHIGNRPAPKRP